MLRFFHAAPAILLLSSGIAQGAILDFSTVMGNANIYTISDFSALSSDVEGGLISGGSVNIANYSVNWENRDAFSTKGKDGYALVVRDNLTLKGGSINHGSVFVGGSSSYTHATAVESTSSSPIDFDAASAYYKGMSANLAKVAGTGIVSPKWSGVVLQGTTGSNVEVFDVDSSVFKNSSHWMFDNMAKAETLIFNVSGSSATFNNGGISFEPLSKYNVLFNFYEATDLDVRGIIGSVLAPYATVSTQWGVVNGAVVVDTWSSTIQVNANHYFKPVDIAGYTAPNLTSPVPEPAPTLLLLTGLAGIALARARKPL